jgi:hypothetical protein
MKTANASAAPSANDPVPDRLRDAPAISFAFPLARFDGPVDSMKQGAYVKLSGYEKSLDDPVITLYIWHKFGINMYMPI